MNSREGRRKKNKLMNIDCYNDVIYFIYKQKARKKTIVHKSRNDCVRRMLSTEYKKSDTQFY